MFSPGKGTFKSDEVGLTRLGRAGRLWPTSQGTIRYVRYFDDFPVIPFSNMWTDTGTGSFTEDKVYVVQTNTKVIERCILMTTDVGDLVFDPTCGSGTTAYVAEQWGRRWITIDTSRVALALARARIMGARYPFYLLADSREGQIQGRRRFHALRAEHAAWHRNVRHGFVYERVPHIGLRSITNNAEIDVSWEKWQGVLEPLREKLNAALRTKWQDWEYPARRRQSVGGAREAPRGLVDRAHREAEGDRRLDWRQGRLRVPLLETIVWKRGVSIALGAIVERSERGSCVPVGRRERGQVLTRRCSTTAGRQGIRRPPDRCGVTCR